MCLEAVELKQTKVLSYVTTLGNETIAYIEEYLYTDTNSHDSGGVWTYS